MKDDRFHFGAVCILFVFLSSGCGHPGWERTETDNLWIFYKEGSYAQAHLATAKRLYEDSFHIADQFVPQAGRRPKIKVFLYDQLNSKGFAKVRKREVHYRFSEQFRLTSVHEFLHIFLFELNPLAPLRFEEGVCRLNEGKRKEADGQAYEIQYYQLVKFTPSDQWALREVFPDHYKDDEAGNIAAAFALFAYQQLGERAFWSFYADLDKTNWPQQVQRYFGKDIATVEHDFQAFVRSIPDPPELFRYQP